MIDVALDMGHGLQRHAQASDRADETAADHYILCRHIPFERGALAENQGDARDVAMDLAIEMDLAFRRHVARDPQVLADRRIANFSRSLGIDRVSKNVRPFTPPPSAAPTSLATVEVASWFQEPTQIKRR